MGDLNRREFLATVAGGAAAVTLSGRAAAGPPADAPRPNVLFYFADQYRADNCGVYGGRNITTPNIDRLAREGITLTGGRSTCPLCTPFRGMLMTGRYPTHSGLVLNWVEASPRQNPACLANVFAAAGYDTAMIGKWHLSAGRLKHAGKAEPNWKAVRAYERRNPHTEFTPPGPDRLGFRHWEAFNFHCDFNNYYCYRDEPEKITSEKYETDTQVDQAIAYMKRQQQAGRPFMAVVAPHPPHPPFRPDASPAGYLENIPEEFHWRPNVPADHPRRTRPAAIRCYYAMSKNVDDNVGRLLRFLDASGLAGNTIVVFTSDHGEMHGSHNRINKMVPYAEAVDVPLVVRFPGRIAAGARSDALVTPIDHLPTLCGLAGLSVPDTADGSDLSHVLLGRGRSPRRDVLMMNYVSHWDFFQTGSAWPEWRGVHSGRHTYVKWLGGREELYDNHDDPYQMANLAEGQKDLPNVKRFRRRLKDLLADAHDEFLPGAAYANWYDDQRNLVRTALGPLG